MNSYLLRDFYKSNDTKILERGLAICGSWPNRVCEKVNLTFSTSQDWIFNPMLKRIMTYLAFEPGTFGLAVSITTTPFRFILIINVLEPVEFIGKHHKIEPWYL
jgi:hypothetical protein